MECHEIEVPWDLSRNLIELLIRSILIIEGNELPAFVNVKTPYWRDSFYIAKNSPEDNGSWGQKRPQECPSNAPQYAITFDNV